MKTLNVAIYARVSTTDQDCSLQLREVQKYADARGWEVRPENIYVDTGWSGVKASRPQMNRLMDAALSRKIDVILVYKLDRWGRSVCHMVQSISKLTTAGVRFIAATQSIDTDKSNPHADLMLVILAAVAQFERALIQERVLAGIRRYRQDFEAGDIGTTKTSKSGKNLAHGRPQKMIDRQRIWDMKDAEESVREIAKACGVSIGMVQRTIERRRDLALVS